VLGVQQGRLDTEMKRFERVLRRILIGDEFSEAELRELEQASADLAAMEETAADL
jgi:hypothetical protein